MTRAEIAAFNSGLATAGALASAAATVLRARLVERPTRYGFAIEALDAVADEIAGMHLPMPPDDAALVSVAFPKPSPSPMLETA